MPRSTFPPGVRASHTCCLHLSACTSRPVSSNSVPGSISSQTWRSRARAPRTWAPSPCTSNAKTSPPAVATSLGWTTRSSMACREAALRDASATALSSSSSAMPHVLHHALRAITAHRAARSQHPALPAASTLREAAWILLHASNAHQGLVARKPPPRMRGALSIPTMGSQGSPSALGRVEPQRSVLRAPSRPARTSRATKASTALRA